MNIRAGLSGRLVSVAAAFVVFLLSVLVSLADAQTFNASTATELRNFLENAAANSEDDIIILAKGTYSTADGVPAGTFRFVGSKAHNLTIQAAAGLTANDVVLDGANTHQVLSYTNTAVSTLTLDRISITHGKAINTNGGGVAVNNSNNLIVTGSIISVNTASTNSDLAPYGGGIYCGGAVTVTNSNISDNAASASAVASYGGGIYAEGTVSVTDSTISGNTAFANFYGTPFSYGGGIYGGGAVTVTNSNISGNAALISAGNTTSAASYGGGIYGVGAVTVTNSTISVNKAYTASGGLSYGGGIYGAGAVTVTNSTISDNTASPASSSYGGGIYGTGAVAVTNSNVSGNTAFADYGSAHGGCIYGGGTVTVTNSTIFGNQVSSALNPASGGGIYGTGAVTVTSSTISGNTSSNSSGGIYGAGIFVNSIFTNNSTDIWFSGASYVYNNFIDYTKLQNEYGGHVVQKNNNIQPGAGSLNFVDISFRIGQGSVAIDMGLDPVSAQFIGLFTDQTTLQTVQNALLTDKDGNPRIVGATIDLGAYEYSSNNLYINPYIGTGIGRVISQPAAIDCGPGNTDCFAYFPSVTMVRMEAIPETGGSIFSLWSGDADCNDGEVTVDQPVSCIASFTQCSALMIALVGRSFPNDSIGAAYAQAGASPFDIIDIIGSNQAENLNFGRGVTVTLNGGYDCGFNVPPLLMTTITGSVTVTSGTVTLNNIRIQ